MMLHVLMKFDVTRERMRVTLCRYCKEFLCCKHIVSNVIWNVTCLVVMLYNFATVERYPVSLPMLCTKLRLTFGLMIERLMCKWYPAGTCVFVACPSNVSARPIALTFDCGPSTSGCIEGIDERVVDVKRQTQCCFVVPGLVARLRIRIIFIWRKRCILHV